MESRICCKSRQFGEHQLQISFVAYKQKQKSSFVFAGIITHSTLELSKQI